MCQEKGRVLVFWGKVNVDNNDCLSAQVCSVQRECCENPIKTPRQSIFQTRLPGLEKLLFLSFSFRDEKPASRWNTGVPLQLRGPFFLLPLRVLVNMCWCDQARAQRGDILCWGAGEGAGTMISAGRKGRENPTSEGLIDSNTQPMWPKHEKIVLPWACQKKKKSTLIIQNPPWHPSTSSSTHMNYSDMLISTCGGAWGKALSAWLCISHHQYAGDLSESYLTQYWVRSACLSPKASSLLSP